MCMDVLESIVEPRVKSGEKVLFVLFDGLSYTEAIILKKELEARQLKLTIKPYLSLVPSITIYARNAIFSGMTPRRIEETWGSQALESNRKERDMLREYFRQDGVAVRYENYGNLSAHADELRQILKGKYTLVACVVRLVDIILSQAPSGEFSKKDAHGFFSSAVKGIVDLVEEVVQSGWLVIIGSDHGNIDTEEPIEVKMTDEIVDRELRGHSRYFAVSKVNRKWVENALAHKLSLCIDNPEAWELPASLNTRATFVAIDPFRFSRRRSDVTIATHGGISLDEMVIPIIEVRK